VADLDTPPHELTTSSTLWGLLARLGLSAAPYRAMQLQNGVQLVSRRGSHVVGYREFRALSLRRGLLGKRLVVRTGGFTHSLKGLRGRDVQPFYDAVREQWALYGRRWLDEWHETNRTSIDFVESLNSLERYARRSQAVSHVERLSRALGSLQRYPLTALDDHPIVAKLPELEQFVADSDGVVSEANRRFVAEECARSQRLFEVIESNPLTSEQQVAVVTDEDRNLVVAAAGSGKTSVIVAKVAHILRQGDIPPSRLLVLAFNRAARDELRERISRKVGGSSVGGVSVMTFHGLGYSIITDARKQKPSVAKHAGEVWRAAQLVREIVDELRGDRSFERCLSEWFAWHLHEYKSAFDFETLGEYFEYLEQNRIITLKGEEVKSFEECMIANFLCLQGIDYLYEPPYEHETADEEHRQYQPDFFLPEHRIYIEHFGIDREGRTAPFVDEGKYREGMRWKRALHEIHRTDLVETFTYQRREGRLISTLKEALLERGVTLTPASVGERLDQLRGTSEYDRFSELIAVFLAHFISNGEDRSTLRGRARAFPDAERAGAFLDVFFPVWERYRHRMAESHEVDFEIMIQDATEIVEEGGYASPYRYILVDEFQDISVGRAKLLKALCEQRPENQLLAVGDDWQSIYRFAGSDISVMRRFEEHFGPTARSDLSTTFRCNQQLVDLSSSFVAANPSQLAKEVRASRQQAGDAAFVWRYPAEGEPPVAAVLDRIQEESPSGSVLVLGRYRHNRPGNWSSLESSHRDLDLAFQTVHAAKGLEADYVIVLGLEAGLHGFPSELRDDPLLELVLAEEERFQHAEERRLLYVAITRAKHAVFLMAPDAGGSAFVRELEGGSYGAVALGADPSSRVRCPLCNSGILSLRAGANGAFVGCSNYPRCTHASGACPACRAGIVEIRDGVGACNTCNADVEGCPRCSAGYLRHRRGRYGDFSGCSTYPSCRFTRALDARPRSANRRRPTN